MSDQGSIMSDDTSSPSPPAFRMGTEPRGGPILIRPKTAEDGRQYVELRWGDPVPDVGTRYADLTPSEARQVAYALLWEAERVSESASELDDAPSNRDDGRPRRRTKHNRLRLAG